MSATLPAALAQRARSAGAVVAGGSAGAVETLLPLLRGLPGGLTVPLAIVVHLPRRRPSALAAVLASACGCLVSEPLDKEPLAPGRVYLAAPDYHLLVDPGPAFALSIDPPVHHSRPSIDVLLESASWVFGPRLLAIVLSGANEDGARGLAAVCAAGGMAVVQDPAEAASPVMPAAAAAACPGAVALRPGPLRELLRGLAPEAASLPARPGDNRKSDA